MPDNIVPLKPVYLAFSRACKALNKKVDDGTFIWEATGVRLYDFYYENLIRRG